MVIFHSYVSLPEGSIGSIHELSPLMIINIRGKGLNDYSISNQKNIPGKSHGITVKFITTKNHHKIHRHKSPVNHHQITKKPDIFSKLIPGTPSDLPSGVAGHSSRRLPWVRSAQKPTPTCEFCGLESQQKT